MTARRSNLPLDAPQKYETTVPLKLRDRHSAVCRSYREARQRIEFGEGEGQLQEIDRGAQLIAQKGLLSARAPKK
jgi:hypothetical protein